MTKIQLQITRSKWDRRTLDEFNYKDSISSSRLQKENGQMCCMGFDCHLIHKISYHDLLHQFYPQL